MTSHYTLLDAQAHFSRTIALGPSALPGRLFAGSDERILRGLKVHANTVSHARLVGLEETFPRTRAAIGDAAFNALSRNYLDAGNGRDQSLDQLGEGFPHWLEINSGFPAAVAVARFEWLWLAAYNAREGIALSIEDLSAAGAEHVLGLRLCAHPAARLLRETDGIATVLGIPNSGLWLLITRADADVLVHQIDDATAALFVALAPGAILAAAFETFLTNRPNSNPLAAMHTLIAAGALTKG